MELASKLNKSGVEVVDVFYSKEEAALGHEYHFIVKALKDARYENSSIGLAT